MPMEKLQNPISIDDLRCGVSFSRLPKHFGRATVITRLLGKKHIWIDSLCIVQNSPNDWQEQSSLMHMVYGSAFCTISADMLNGEKGHLDGERLPSHVNPTVVRPTWPEARGESYRVVPLDLWRCNISESFLGVRAWALQERLLSPRVVHFGRSQIFFECNTRSWCESFPDGLPDELSDDNDRFKGLDVVQDGTALMKKLQSRSDLENVRFSLSGEIASERLIKSSELEKCHPEASSTLASIDASCVNRIIGGAQMKEQVGEEPKSSHSPPAFFVLDKAANEFSVDNNDEKSVEDGAEIPDSVEHLEKYEQEDYAMGGYYLWARILEKYTTTNLTFPSDKFVAIEGLSNYLSRKLNDTFISGLWRKTLVTDLLWSVKLTLDSDWFPMDKNITYFLKKNPYLVTGKRPLVSRAPTWS